jgi:hypothetical protein
VIGGYFGITTAQLSAANQIAPNTTLRVNTTLLIPLTSLPPIATINFATVPPPPPDPVPFPPAPSLTASVVVSKLASKTPLHIGIAVGALGLTLLLCKACEKQQPWFDSTKGGLYESHGYYQDALSGSQEDLELALKPNAFHLEMSDMLAGMSDMVGSGSRIPRASRLNRDEVLNSYTVIRLKYR